MKNIKSFVNDAQKMIDFCALVGNENKEICYKQIGTSLVEWSADKDQALQNCRKIKDPQGYNWCMNVN